MNLSKTHRDQTRERILDKAETLFAQKGYHAVSVREITTAAKCNMASVNYHFSNKKNLYLEVFRSRWIPREKKMYDTFIKNLARYDVPSPRESIEALAKAYLEGPLNEQELRRHRQLIIREINNPTEAFEIASDETSRPLFDTLYNLLKPFMPPGTQADLTFDVMSIFGIVLYMNYSRPMVSRITGKTYDDTFKSLLIEQMVRFSLQGLGVEKNT